MYISLYNVIHMYILTINVALQKGENYFGNVVCSHLPVGVDGSSGSCKHDIYIRKGITIYYQISTCTCMI